MGIPTPRASLLGLLLLMCALDPAALLAQQAVSAPSADLELTSFAEVFIEVGSVRDAIGAQLAQPQNKTPEHQAGLRREMRDRVAQVIRAHGLSVERFQRIEYTIMVDETRRAAFEELVRRLENVSEA